MPHPWDLRAPSPTGLVTPVPVDPSGLRGPTRGQAAGPRWRRTSPGRYVSAAVEQTVEQRILEAAQRLPASGAVTGWAALRLWGGAFFDGTSDDGVGTLPVRLVTPGRHRRDWGATRIDRGRLDPGEVRLRHGVRCVEPVRAVFDEARTTCDVRSAVVAIDMAAAAGLVDLPELAAYAATRRRWPGATQARVAARLAAPRSRSRPETLMRLIWVLDARLPAPRCNWPVADLHGRRIGRPDLLCEELGVYGEYDGAEHRHGPRRRVDAAREQAFRDVGLEGFTLVGADLADIRLVVERMRAAVRRAQQSARPRAWMVAHDPGPL